MAECPECEKQFDVLTAVHATTQRPEESEPGSELMRFGDRVLIRHSAKAARPVEPPPHETPAPVSGESPASGQAAATRRRFVFASSDFLKGYVSLASRNVLRHGRRSALAIAAIGFGVVALVLASGFIEWTLWAMREDTIRALLGHIQVVRPGYLTEGAADPLAFLLDKDRKERGAIEASSSVRTVAPRLGFSGLISYGEVTVSFVGEGVDPQREALVSTRLEVSQGENLSIDEPSGIIIGQGLAANLDVKPGDSVVLLATSSSGGINAVEARVRGVFFTLAKAFDDTVIRVPIDLARDLVQVSGEHTWVVVLDDTDKTEEVFEDLRARFPAEESNLEFVPWYELADFYNQTVTLFSRQVNVVQVIIGLIIVLSISNTLIMSALERTHEIGTLMAMGIKRRAILGLFVTEGLLLGFVGGAIGLAIGFVLAQIISAIEIPMPPAPGMAVGFTGEILVSLKGGAIGFVIAVSATFLASLYPSWKASRLNIVDALRHNR